MYNLALEFPEDCNLEYISQLNSELSLTILNPEEKIVCSQDIIKAKPHLLKCTNLDTHPKNLDQLPSQRSHTLCILSVPNWIKDFNEYLHSLSSDFIAECLESLTNIRTILHSSYYSTVLIQFSTQMAADNFYTIFNGRDFDEPRNQFCYIVFVSKISYNLGNWVHKDFFELPLCPICLERVDVSISGVIGILRAGGINLAKERWTEAEENCKVCSSLKLETQPKCENCNCATDIWLCLICGNKGCGRYQAAHSKSHFSDTGHNFTIELSSQCVWDYLTDNYVHRLLYNNRETLVLDLEFSQIAKENIERMINEYNHIISLQLEQQRAYYEQKISSILIDKSENLHQEFKEVKLENDYLKREISKIRAFKKKKEAKESLLKKIIDENLEIEEMNKNLRDYVSNPQETWIFDDKKSKATYSKLERLRSELQSIMSSLS